MLQIVTDMTETDNQNLIDEEPMQTIGNQSDIPKNDNDWMAENFEEDGDFDNFAESEKEANTERNTVSQP